MKIAEKTEKKEEPKKEEGKPKAEEKRKNEQSSPAPGGKPSPDAGAKEQEKKELKKEERDKKDEHEKKQEAPPEATAAATGPQVKDIISKSSISLSLDRYDDIFSDFDPRSYSERALSDDFLSEAKKVTREKKDNFELELLIPEGVRQTASEAKIKKRLKDHFKKHADMLKAEQKKVKQRGLMVVLIGFILMLAASFLYDLDHPLFALTFLRTMIEPAGWFMVWYGLDQVFYTGGQHKSEIEFNEKMSKASIRFTSY
ncbi:hypothetical protein JW711_02925 [Candidatus Woesearchaeota archaeon]|nr:hypothetical protein [Candidatus Woesearchaeota archaeon]